MYDIERLKELMFTDYPDLVDVAQLQEMLAVNRHTAYDLIGSGAFKCAKVGRKDIAEWFVVYNNKNAGYEFPQHIYKATIPADKIIAFHG